MKIAVAFVLLALSSSGCIQNELSPDAAPRLEGTKATYALGNFQNTIWKSEETTPVMDKHGNLVDAFFVVVDNNRHKNLDGQFSTLEVPYQYWIKEGGEIVAFHADGPEIIDDFTYDFEYRVVQTRYEDDARVPWSDPALLLQLTLTGEEGAHSQGSASVQWTRDDSSLTATGRAYEQCFRATYTYTESAWASQIDLEYGFGTCSDKQSWQLVSVVDASYPLMVEGKALPEAELEPVSFALEEVGPIQLYYPEFLGQFEGVMSSLDALMLRLIPKGTTGPFVVTGLDWKHKGGPTYDESVFGPADWDALIFINVATMDGSRAWIDYFHVKEGVPVPLTAAPSDFFHLFIQGPVSVEVDWMLPVNQVESFVGDTLYDVDQVTYQYWGASNPSKEGFVSFYNGCFEGPVNVIEVSLGQGVTSNYFANRDYSGVKACNLGIMYR